VQADHRASARARRAEVIDPQGHAVGGARLELVERARYRVKSNTGLRRPR
jgi:hypothetical protein